MAKKDTLKELPPEERIKRLKEIEKEKKREIEEAHKLLQESEEELTEEHRWKEKVPIPEVAKEDLEELSQEGKQLLKLHKGLRGKLPAEEEKETVTPRRKKDSLEETVEQEKIALSREAQGLEYGSSRESRFGMEYKAVSERPLGELYQDALALKHSVQEKGYVSRDDERRAEYLTGVVEDRLRAAEEGEYSMTKDIARAASLMMRIGEEIQTVYHRKSDNPTEHNWYKGR
jgi:hypothetical protein